MIPHGPWQIVSSREVYRDAWIALRRDEVIRPDGRPGHHCVLDLKPGVCVLAVDDEPRALETLRRTLEDDFYVLLTTWEGTGSGAATFKIYVNPLVNWVWAGGLIFILGTLVAAWPDAETRRKVAAKGRLSARPAPAVGD